LWMIMTSFGVNTFKFLITYSMSNHTPWLIKFR
jgi:hypothetical protein